MNLYQFKRYLNNYMETMYSPRWTNQHGEGGYITPERNLLEARTIELHEPGSQSVEPC